MRVNSFIKIDDKNFKKIYLSMIKKNLNKFVEFVSKKSKNDADFNKHESLFHKQKIEISFRVKDKNWWCSKFVEISSSWAVWN